MAKNTKGSGGKQAKTPLYATQEYRDAKANPLASNRSAMLDEDKTKLIAKAEAQRIRDIVASTPAATPQFPKDIEQMRRKNPGQSFQYFDNKTNGWVKVPALDPSQSMRAQGQRLQFDENGQPADKFTQNFVKQARFGPDGKPYGAHAATLIKNGYVPPVKTPTPVAPTPTPVAPTPTPVAVSDQEAWKGQVYSLGPQTQTQTQTPTVPTTFVTDPVSEAYPAYGKMAASARAPSFSPAGNGANPYQKAGVAGFVAPKAASTFASAQPKTSNKQGLNGLGAQADFGRSFGDSYSKNGNKKDGLF